MAQPRRTVSSSGETVTVACKLPHGLVLRLFEMVPTHEPVVGGGQREVKVAREITDQRITLNGWSHPQNEAPRCQIVGGFALTPGVPKEFWDRWLHDNQKLDMVKNGLIFAHSQQASAVDEAEEKAKERSGLERLDPNKLPKGIQKSDLAKEAA